MKRGSVQTSAPMRICQRSMPDTKVEDGVLERPWGPPFAIPNPPPSPCLVQYRRLVEIWSKRARMSIRILHFVGLRRQPLTRPSAVAKATARQAGYPLPIGWYLFSAVGMARCAVRAAERRNAGWDCHVYRRRSFRPLLRGRGHRSAMSLPLNRYSDGEREG